MRDTGRMSSELVCANRSKVGSVRTNFEGATEIPRQAGREIFQMRSVRCSHPHEVS